MSEKVKDVAVRAVKTFLETAGSYLIANLSGIDFSAGTPGRAFWLGLALSTGAAGLAAAWNGVIAPLIAAKTGVKQG